MYFDPFFPHRLKKTCQNSEYDQEIPQSQTSDSPVVYREEEPHNNHKTPGRQKKQSNQLSLPRRDDIKLEWTQSNAQQNI